MGPSQKENEEIGIEGDRVIDSYIKKAVDEGEIDPDELDSNISRGFWDKNTIRAAVIGVVVLFCVNVFFYYTMKVEEADNSLQWELSKRDFLVEYRESRLAAIQETSSVPVDRIDAHQAGMAVEVSEPSTIEPVDHTHVTEALPEAQINSNPETAVDEPGPELEPISASTMQSEHTEAEVIAFKPLVESNDLAASNQANEEIVAQVLRDWVKAWSFQDIETYLSYYSEDFISPAGAPIGPWRALRTERVSKPEWIHVVIEDLRVLVDDDLAVAEFQQVYAASNFSDESIKTLVMKNEDGRWKILEEESKAAE